MIGSGIAHQGPPVASVLRAAPGGWQIRRLKTVATINRDALPDTTDPDFAFRYIDIGSVDNLGRVRSTEELTFSSSPSRARRRVTAGDSIVSTVRTYLRAIAYVDDPGDDLIASTGFATLTATDHLLPRYLYWWLRAGPFVEEVVARSVGVSYPAVNASDIADTAILVPPRDQQRQIVKFLDAETARIDELIAEQEHLRQLSNERYQVKLLHYVAGGLEPAPTRARPELGGLQAVAEWQVRPLRSLPVQIQTGPFGSQLHQSDYVDGGIPVVNPANLAGGRIRAIDSMTVSEATRSRLARHVLQVGDVVFGRRGEMGRAGLVSQTEEGWLCGTGSLRIRFFEPVFDSGYLKRYLETSLVRQYLEAASVGATMDNLNAQIVGRVPLLIPPIEAQRAIAAELDGLEERMIDLDRAITANLGLLHEHRQALITAAVTGGLEATVRAA